MQAGELDQVIEIYRYTTVPDDMGGHIKQEQLFSTEWAKVRPASRKEKKEHDKLRDSANYVFTIRYRDDIGEEMFIRWNKRDYNIRFISDRGARDLYIRLEAERGVNN